MPRGRKKVTPEERLDQIDKQIDELTEKLGSLKIERKETEQKIKNQQLAELFDIVQSSGKSMEEVKAMLSQHDQETIY